MKIKKIVLVTLKDSKIINIDVDFENIKHFELNGVNRTISHDTFGELIEFYDASKLELLIHKNMLDSDILNEIVQLNEIISAGVELENNEVYQYNLNKEVSIDIDDEIIKLII